MRILVTGGLGFIGRSVVAVLRSDGAEVTAIVRDPASARIDASMVRGDLSSGDELRAAMAGHDAVVHLAGSYRIGVAARDRPAMWAANVGATERVLDAAAAAGVPRIVHVSTVNVLGNTRGSVVDEGHVRDRWDGFLSWYDETKFRAHEVAIERIARGAPVVVAMPGGVYGPDDHSAAGRLLERAFRGRLRLLPFPEAGLTWALVDDVARGIAAVATRGRVGESYVLAGPAHRLRDAMAIAAEAGGHRRRPVELPSAPVRALSRLPFAPAGLREAVRASDGVTYWASAEKARRELGWAARDLATGVRDAWA